ncbi:MAG: hypothetical protein IT204_25190 [Fimbriimonadaceae bacterium]|nr:hypothetical protein [Fimbriimonadaceae bacterium]
MDDVTRRAALATAVGAGLGSLVQAAESAPQTDRDCVLGAGLTPGEADCWELAAKCAGAFFALPELHPMDRQEIATAIHVIQNKLLGRPTYRRYLELAKARQGVAP